MHQNIKINNVKSIDAKLYSANYFDFMLHKGEVVAQSNYDLSSMLLADFSDFNIVNGVLYSSIQWSGATNNGVELNDIGFTGIDNGFISFKKDKITEEEFTEIFTNSQYKITSGDTRLFLTPVTGNTLVYNYPIFLGESNGEKYVAYRGGFHQGFFKLQGHEYQVLPEKMDCDWTFHFVLRPRTDAVLGENNINYTHKNNNGIFFYMGTRAENKFWPLYKTDEDVMNGFKKNDLEDTSSVKDYYDSEGRPIDSYGYQELTTDNKFLLFDRTSSGFTVDTWVEGTEVTFRKQQNHPNHNYFLLMDRTSTGYTKDTIAEYNAQIEYDYDIYKDIQNNVFALRITEDGAIGYRYGALNCDNESHYEMIEEYSKPNIVKGNEWNSINVRISKISDDEMKLYFYVNGYLVFISKTLKPFEFKPINDVAEKQEGVPYNISLGGGSLGLMETILTDYQAISNYVLPIERDFCGSFMGDIKSFKMYGGYVSYSSLINYLS